MSGALVAKRYLETPEETAEPTCGPGPFSRANADTTSEILLHAGWADVALYRCDQDLWIGADVDEAVDFNMAIGPAGELIRLNGDGAQPYVQTIQTEVREALGGFSAEDGVRAPSSSWIVTATAP